MRRPLQLALLFAALAVPASASEYRGVVTFNELPVPGATIVAIQGDRRVVVTTDQQGGYVFADLSDGAWTIRVEMSLFASQEQQVTIAAKAPAGKWELKLLPLDQIMAKATAPKPVAKPALVARAPEKKGADKAALPEIPKPAEDTPRPSDGLLINGSVNNAATSQFTLAQAFGNSRSSKSLYTGGVSLVLDNSVFDARPYSLAGIDTPKAAYNHITGGLTFGGPLNIPHLLRHGPNFFVAYQWMRTRTDATQSGLVPTLAQRAGDYAGGLLPINPVAQQLLSLYPLPNIAGSTRYNYQVPVIGNTHQDAVSARMDRSIGRRDSVNGLFAFQSTRSDNENLFGFVDTTDLVGENLNLNWSHRFSRQILNTAGYRFSRVRTRVTPEFQNRVNVSGSAGIAASPAPGGNAQDATDWGPPTLVFSSVSTLSDALSSNNRNETNAVTDSVTWSHRHHNLTLGGDFRRQEFNILAQGNPRGTYTFTGAYAQATVAGATASGADFADFLLGTPDTAQIAFGNADKYLRQSVYDAYVTDDWRVRPELTVNYGIRWDYGAPATELKGRLVNLDVSPGFTAAQPVVANDPLGPVTGDHYATSLVNPDKHGFEPRIGISWRPVAGSTLVIRAGYGIYDDTSVYEPTALAMSQQAPLANSVDVSNSSTCMLTLAAGFKPCTTTTADSIAVDPNLHVGYAQDWNVSAQRDLPGALVATLTYTGIKGTHGVQEYLPNSYPLGAANPCPSCPSGFVYRASGGNAMRESGQVQLRRRLRSGFSASLLYTYSRSVDDDASFGGGGPVAAGAAVQALAPTVIAQNWLNLKGERGLSSFDQRHVLNATAQYTSGQGIGGGTLMSGWRGVLLKQWTVLTSITAGTGLPETPVYLAATPGTGVTGSIRPSTTGANIYAASGGYHLNSAAYTAPTPGQWGTAGRDSIEGPGSFTLTAALQRTFRMKDHMNLDTRMDATNLLNHVVFASWNTILNGTTFGLPASANAMRSLQLTMRLRY